VDFEGGVLIDRGLGDCIVTYSSALHSLLDSCSPSKTDVPRQRGLSRLHFNRAAVVVQRLEEDAHLFFTIIDRGASSEPNLSKLSNEECGPPEFA
jgi:hypothetical protein